MTSSSDLPNISAWLRHLIEGTHVIVSAAELAELECDAASWRRLDLMYEDELPEMPEYAYNEWFEASQIVCGVRMGPAIKDCNGKRVRK